MAVAIEFGSQGHGLASSGVATISGLDFNAEASDRIIAAGISVRGDCTISGVTIGGVTASVARARTRTEATPDLTSAIYTAAVPTGTSGDVVVTLSVTTTTSVSVSTHSITGADATPTDSDDASGSGANISITALTIPTDGAGIANFANAASTAVSWTGATVSHDTDVNTTSNNHRHSAAIVSAAGTNTITADGATSSQVLVGVAWGPAAGGDEGVGSSAGSATAAATGQSTARASSTVAGTSTVAATGQSTAASVGSAAGTSTAAATGTYTGEVEAVGTAAGTSTASAVGSSTGGTTTDTHDGIGYGDPFRRKRRPKKGKREKAVEDLLKKLMGLVPDDPPPEIEAEAEIAQASVERLFAPTVDVAPNLEALQFAQLQLAKLEAMLNRYLEDEEDEDDLLLMAA